MKIKLEEPFASDWKLGYLQKNREGRNIVCLVNNNKERTTIAYARYLMSVKLGRYLTADESVDHIDNDKTNDSLDNLQILEPLQNIQKYRDTLPAIEHGSNTMYRNGCRCDLCKRWHAEYTKNYRRTHSSYNKKTVEKICAQCGKTFYVSSGHKSQRFCCQGCSNTHRSQH